MQKLFYARPVSKEFEDLLKHYQKQFSAIKFEMSKAIVGQQEIINSLIEALLCNGHVLVEGVPGIAKTLTVRTLSQITGGVFSRIQFTPDLLPTDIIGITTYEEGRGFYSVKGPIFANFVLADEINRAPPKVQSALLEAMQERQVTIGKESFALPSPFFVMATQNPIESLGTYKLPEAQIDRFMFKLKMDYPNVEDELKILHTNSTLRKFEEFKLSQAMTPDTIIRAQQDVKKIYLDKKVEKYIVRLVEATRYAQKYNLETGKYIEYGTSPRSSIALFIASKAHALVKGKSFVTPMDVKEVAHNVLRHRIILNYEGQADEISTDTIIDELLKKVHID
ncbi:TPA: MoxR family ATPase [Candidatus Woesearchaeota archaeon]|nr:MoxR family ATPase [Candidatus Woesearchaeota archaeon]HIH31770.1 MoxR family ATPase [Candidatus Woesearchaeota archaeon]HIH54669.1 MoxR family ATPase [Candidatus Woesearchaeota archaeon]HIJ01556.1 MoxR family ATPase [Candidatus Woesearchaeota archaeon]HIJ13959.1 MoxR family ATPase [Candidatus Woesearchaeota archaeon]